MIDAYNHERFIKQASVSVRKEDFQMRSEKRVVIPAAPFYWRLIDEFEKHTGVPVLLNTGANLRRDAIVDTPTDANRTLFSCAMDALALRSFLIEK